MFNNFYANALQYDSVKQESRGQETYAHFRASFHIYALTSYMTSIHKMCKLARKNAQVYYYPCCTSFKCFIRLDKAH